MTSSAAIVGWNSDAMSRGFFAFAPKARADHSMERQGAWGYWLQQT